MSNYIRDISISRGKFTKGDRVVVVKGRKVPVGTSGVVAWVSRNTGGVLVKSEDSNQIESATGIWMNPKNLERIKES